MAYLITHFWPGATMDQYSRTVEAVHPAGGLPEGQTYHAAGPTEGGVLIAAVWESKDKPTTSCTTCSWRRCPSTGGFEGGPEERSAEIGNLQSS